MIRLIFIILASFLMIGAAIGALYYWDIDPLELFGFTPPSEEEMMRRKAAAAAIPPAYVDFGPMIVPVVQDHEVKQQAEMILRLEVVASKKDFVANNLPRLQNAFLTDMMEFIPTLLAEDRSSFLDTEKVGNRLRLSAEKVLGPDVVTRVLIEQSALK